LPAFSRQASETGHPVTVAVIGAGSRGGQYAAIAARLGAQIVAVADPAVEARADFAKTHGVPPVQVFRRWEDLAAAGRLADVAVIATPDHEHVEPALACAALGYDILLEKPIAPTEDQAARVIAAARSTGVMVAVCHVLRHTPHTLVLKRMLGQGAIGDLVSVEHLEPIGWWHFAHSFVRGNWRDETASSSMLLAKSCHDIDWLNHVVGRPARRVSSFGSLFEFTADRKPAGAAERCLDCGVSDDCPYSAPRVYGGFLGDPDHELWPLSVLTRDLTEAGLERALRDGPYGECVYNGHNDVVDHQVVSIEYEGGVTASFTVAAFTEMAFRKTRLFGTRGCIESDGRLIVLRDFVTGETQMIDSNPGASDASAASGHGGGDEGLVRAFLECVTSGDREAMDANLASAFASHQAVWAAERARRSGTVVALDPQHRAAPEWDQSKRRSTL
jgi:predicted dehydrogenase